MNNALNIHIHALSKLDLHSSEWRLAIVQIAKTALKSRTIARRRSSQPLAPIYQEIYSDLKETLIENIEQAAASSCAKQMLTPTGISAILTQSSQQILTYDRITQLAVHLQQQPFRSAAWQHAMNELFTAVHLSKKLKRPTSYGANAQDTYLDITNEALSQAIRDIQKFNPERAHFIGWINQIYIDRRGITIRHQQEDTLKRSHHTRVMPIKYALGRTLALVEVGALKQQIALYLKAGHTYAEVEFYLLLSIVICLLQRQVQDEPVAGSQLLFAIAEAATGRSVEFESLDMPRRSQEDSGHMREIPTPSGEPPRIDFLRNCLESCSIDGCIDILQKHVRANPQATLRSIALQRLEGKTLKEISATFGIIIPTIQKFYERNISKVADSLERCVEDKIAIWKMQHPS